MNAFAKYDQFDDLRKRYPNARLKLKATIDGRERTQSREMNGQISNAKGEFLYPDSKYYRLGTAPAQWCINDRETCYIVFLDNKEVKENREELRELKEKLQENNQEQQEQKEEQTKIENLLFPDEIAGVKRGKPMSIEKANEGHVNPKYALGGGYRINCQSCVVNYELRLRGFDTETLPNTKGSTLETLSRKTNLAWIDTKTGKNPDYLQSLNVKNATSCYKWLDETLQEGNRYTLEFAWAGRGNSGHIVSISKKADGLLLYDPQTSNKYTGKGLLNYFKRLSIRKL